MPVRRQMGLGEKLAEHIRDSADTHQQVTALSAVVEQIAEYLPHLQKISQIDERLEVMNMQQERLVGALIKSSRGVPPILFFVSMITMAAIVWAALFHDTTKQARIVGAGLDFQIGAPAEAPPAGAKKND